MSVTGEGLPPREEAQRAELLRRLEQQRRRIDQLLSPGEPAVARLARSGQGGFPRSHTMRLILSEPLLLAALSAVAMRLVGQRAMNLLPLAASVARTVHAMLKPPAQGGRNPP